MFVQIAGQYTYTGEIPNSKYDFMMMKMRPNIRKTQRGNQNPYIEKRTDNAMAKIKRTKGPTTTYKTYT